MFAFSSLITWTLFMQMKIDLESQIEGARQAHVCFRDHEWKMVTHTTVSMTMAVVFFLSVTNYFSFLTACYFISHEFY